MSMGSDFSHSPPRAGCRSADLSNEPKAELWNLLMRSRWDDALKRVIRHPEDSLWRASFFCDASSPFWREDKIVSPLHLAIYLNAPAKLITAILNANPDAATEGPYPPLHVALHRMATPSSSSDSSARESMPGYVPAFFAMRSSLALVLTRLQLPHDVSWLILSFVAHPGTVRAENGRTLQHYACALPDPDRALSIAALLPPEGAHVLDNLGQTPLHLVCGAYDDRPSPSLVKSLVRANKAALTTRTRYGGMTPLHVACTTVKRRDIIQVLAEADNGGAVSLLNNRGMTPLHLYVTALAKHRRRNAGESYWSDRDERWKEAAETAKVLLRHGAGNSALDEDVEDAGLVWWILRSLVC